MQKIIMQKVEGRQVYLRNLVYKKDAFLSFNYSSVLFGNLQNYFNHIMSIKSRIFSRIVDGQIFAGIRVGLLDYECLHVEDFQIPVVANSDPVRVSEAPPDDRGQYEDGQEDCNEHDGENGQDDCNYCDDEIVRTIVTIVMMRLSGRL